MTVTMWLQSSLKAAREEYTWSITPVTIPSMDSVWFGLVASSFSRVPIVSASVSNQLLMSHLSLTLLRRLRVPSEIVHQDHSDAAGTNRTSCAGRTPSPCQYMYAGTVITPMPDS
jgi:hypothetical protein